MCTPDFLIYSLYNVFFCNYSVVVEELPRHPLYTSLSIVEKRSLDLRTINAINTAEQLKKRIKNRYEHEKALNQTNKQINGPDNDHQTRASTSKASSHLHNTSIEVFLRKKKKKTKLYLLFRSINYLALIN